MDSLFNIAVFLTASWFIVLGLDIIWQWDKFASYYKLHRTSAIYWVGDECRSIRKKNPALAAFYAARQTLGDREE